MALDNDRSVKVTHSWRALYGSKSLCPSSYARSKRTLTAIIESHLAEFTPSSQKYFRQNRAESLTSFRITKASVLMHGQVDMYSDPTFLNTRLRNILIKSPGFGAMPDDEGGDL